MANESTQNKENTRIFLQPIAGPQVLGLYSLSAATFLVAAYWAHWFGTDASSVYLFPFVALFGGLAQFLAGMWAFKARDVLATAVHGMWGTFWMAYGLLNLLFVVGTVTPPAGPAYPELGFWFIPVAAITWILTLAAGKESKSLATVLFTLGVGSTLGAIAFLGGMTGLLEIAGYFLIGSSFAAWYTASGGKEIFAIGAKRVAPAVVPGEGEAGVVRGIA
jgi:succinate-acetate transporter protein